MAGRTPSWSCKASSSSSGPQAMVVASSGRWPWRRASSTATRSWRYHTRFMAHLLDAPHLRPPARPRYLISNDLRGGPAVPSRERTVPSPRATPTSNRPSDFLPGASRRLAGARWGVPGASSPSYAAPVANSPDAVRPDRTWPSERQGASSPLRHGPGTQNLLPCALSAPALLSPLLRKSPGPLRRAPVASDLVDF